MHQDRQQVLACRLSAAGLGAGARVSRRRQAPLEVSPGGEDWTSLHVKDILTCHSRVLPVRGKDSPAEASLTKAVGGGAGDECTERPGFKHVG